MFAAPPYFWGGFLALSLPWVHVEMGSWFIYPLVIGFGLVILAMLIREGGWLAAIPALLPGLALGAGLGAVEILRGNWTVGIILLVLTTLHFAWGAAAYQFGVRGLPLRKITMGSVWLLGAMLVMGVTSWVFRALWTTTCVGLTCKDGISWPYPFTGGFHSSGQYLLALVLLLPTFSVILVMALETSRNIRLKTVLIGLTGLAGLGLIAGAPFWAIGIVLLGQALVGGVFYASRIPGGILLFKGSVLGFLFSLVFVYGMAPEYLERLFLSEQERAPIMLSVPEEASGRLFSRKSSPLDIQLLNTGWRVEGETGDPPFQVVARVLMSPKRGAIRYHDLVRVPVTQPLKPGESVTITLPLRLPSWFDEGYLAWRLEDGQGKNLKLNDRSSSGFRVLNANFRQHYGDPENRLSILSKRARDFRQDTNPEIPLENKGFKPSDLVGSMLDTLFFSPLWGLNITTEERIGPLLPDRPFWPEFFRRYGLLGLFLMGWCAWRLYTRATYLAMHETGPAGLGWRVFILNGILVGMIGLFSPAPGSYHAFWAFFLLAGFVEGCYARVHIPIRPKLNPRRSFGLSLPRLPRLPRLPKLRKSPKPPTRRSK